MSQADSLLQWLQQSHEYREFGWNMATVSALLAVGFSIWGFWEHVRQNRILWREREKEGKSLSYNTMGYFCAMNAVFAWYGLHTYHAADFVSGALAVVMYIPILIGLWSFKPLTKIERLVLTPVFAILVIAAVVFTFASEAFLWLSIGGLFSQLHQAWELWHNRDRGVVRVQIFIPYVFKTASWVGYAYWLDDSVQKVTSPLYLIVLGITIAAWRFSPYRDGRG